MVNSGMSIGVNYQKDLTSSAKFEAWNATLGKNSDHARYFRFLTLPIPDSPVVLSDETLLEPSLASSKPGSQLEWSQAYDKLNTKKFTLPYVMETSGVTRHRSSFVSAKGYTGLGSAGAKVGDQVCILLGCDRPLLARKAVKNYLLVGQYYVFGMMKGEIIE